MKIWYQSMTATGVNSAYTAEVSRLVHAATPPDCDVRIAGIPRSSEHSDHQYRFYELVDTRDVVSNAVRAEEEGYSAFLVGNIADPGLHQARELTNLPVLGLGEMSFFLALQMGRRLGLVAITELQVFHITEKVHDLGLSRHVVGFETLDLKRYGDLHGGYADTADNPIISAFRDATERLVTRGADVVMPVGGLAMALLSRAGITAIDGVPIVNGVHALASLGAALGALYETQGHFTSKRLAYASPPPDAMADIRRRMAGQLTDTPLGVVDDVDLRKEGTDR